MINRISIQGVASYSNDFAQEISGLKRINCFYGLNGSGKSTVAKFLQAPGELDYSSCSVTPALGEGVYVYNQKFVKDNFWDSIDQPGVFTVNESNVDAEKTIEVAEQEITKLTKERDQLKEKAESIKKQITSEQTNLENKVWLEKDKFVKTPLEFCLEKKQRKNLFLDAVKGADEASQDVTMDSLLEQAIELEKPDILPKQQLPLISFTGSSIETNSVNSEVIVGSSESYLAGLIEKIGHSDWVREGVAHYEKSDEICPFCQQPTLGDFKANLKALFDETYKQKCSQVDTNLNAYEVGINSMKATILSEKFNDEYVTGSAEFAVAKAELLDCCKANLALLNDKQSKPSNKVELNDTSVYLQALNKCIENINLRIADFNSRIGNKPQMKAKLKSQFWQVHKRTYKAAIELVDDKLNSFGQQIEELSEQENAKKEEILEQQEIIIEQRKHTTNIDTAIENIRTTLTSVGVDDFHIDKVAGTEARYKIVRKNGASENVYETLSEGEKTLITFLYFLEMCKGLIEPDSALGVVDKVIVIDDPVSSLSHNFVYEIATLIQKEIVKKPFKQILLLTHNLFFFHEMMNQANLKQEEFDQEYSLYRVSKNETSKITSLKRTDIRNDYDGFWQIIRDAEKERTWNPILPNAMRNVLEHFFAFVHKKDKLAGELSNLGDENHDFRTLLRYISKGSHSDMVSLTDFGDIDVARFLRIFKQVFVRTGYEGHYKRMIR